MLTVMVAALLLRIVQSYAVQTAARGAAILTVDALNMMLMALLVFLVLRQVMPVASGLAGGAALYSSGVFSGGFSWAKRTMSEGTKESRAEAARYSATKQRDMYVQTGRMLGRAVGQSRRYISNWRNQRR